LLPPDAVPVVRAVLRDYLTQRIRFYETRDARQLETILAATNELQSKLWSCVRITAAREGTPVIAIVISGMNDVLNSQGYTQAAWWNRLPLMAWVLLAEISACCNILFGFSSHQPRFLILLALPLAVSISFFLIADVDSPRRGLIRVQPQNLISLSQS